MSNSFDLLANGMIDALREHVLPKTRDDFARGQVYAIIFGLNQMKLAADWAPAPLRRQVAIQDAAFAEFRRMAAGLKCPPFPELGRTAPDMDAATLERLRDEGDRHLAALLLWATAVVRPDNPGLAAEMAAILRKNIREQLKVEIDLTPKSMFHEIATGEERHQPNE